MSDNSQRPSDRKLTLIAPLAILAVVALMVLGAVLLKPEPADGPPPPATATPPPTPVIAPPALPPPLTRPEVLARVAAAASAAVGGADGPAGREPIINRPFRLRIPFGCNGPTASPAGQQAWVEFDAARRTLKLVARPAIWTDLPMIRQLPVAAEVEAVEGFWLPRPWTDSEACPPRPEPVKAAPVAPAGAAKGEAPAPAPAAGPAAAEAAAAPPPPPETVGLARLFAAGGSRVFRRDGRPYSFVRKVPEGEAPTPAAGYRLVLEGRVTGYPDGRAVRCRAESPDRRPVCLVAVEFDRVAFEDGETGAVLAEWRE
jgi:hypothetical protein